MDPSADANWWHFSIDPKIRGNKIKAGPGGLREVNPVTPDGRNLVDYRTYLGLDRLLSSQRPCSTVPDERDFIITHQLFELAFKMMIFDLAVVAETLTKLLDISDNEEFFFLCTTSEDEYWLPAHTASGRLRYSAETLLPAFAGLLASAENKDETFNSLEFKRFRPALQPASGFQSAQFRLIQSALGKGELLSVRLFPGQEYWRNYESADDRGPVRVIDPVVLRDDASIADPAPGSPLALTASLDDCAHRVLLRLAELGTPAMSVPEIPLITHGDVEAAVEGFRLILSGHRILQEKAGQKPADAEVKDRDAEALFRHDFEDAIKSENNRRTSLRGARAGAVCLHNIAPGGNLALVLNRIVATDIALHGRQEESFISIHFHMVAERIRDLYALAREAGEAEPPRGTGGGGVPYLGFVRNNLIPLFPALIAYLDLEESPPSLS